MVDKKPKGVSVVIPAYNEGESIVETIEEVSSVLESSDLQYEILVVNDGSTDNSSDVIKAIQIENLTPLEHRINKGYGASLKTGIEAARYENIVITDADRTYQNSRIPEIVDLMDDFDMVVGARTINRKNIPLIRRPAKWFLRRFVSLLMWYNVPDLNSGLRGFNKSYSKRLFPLLPDQFSFTSTITIAYLSENQTIHYLDTEYFKRYGNSKIHPIKDFFGFILKIIMMVMYFQPTRIFFPLGIITFIISLGFLLYDIIVLGNLTEKTILTLFFGLNFFMLGFLGQLVVKRTSISNQ